MHGHNFWEWSLNFTSGILDSTMPPYTVPRADTPSTQRGRARHRRAARTLSQTRVSVFQRRPTALVPRSGSKRDPDRSASDLQPPLALRIHRSPGDIAAGAWENAPLTHSSKNRATTGLACSPESGRCCGRGMGKRAYEHPSHRLLPTEAIRRSNDRPIDQVV